MAHIYSTTKNGKDFGLFERIHETDLPYIVKANGNLYAECDCIADAYRLYNQAIREG